jgi:hypothetical protein
MALGTVGTTQISNEVFQANRNIVRNGAMEVHQRGGTITAAAGNYCLDRFQIWDNGDGGFDVSQSTTAPAGFKNSLKVDVTSADTSIASDAYKLLYYRMEGVDAVGLNAGTSDAVTVTISFYVRSNVTGNHSFGIRNDNADRAYFALYNISAADTWERKSITIPFVTTGTWPTTTAGCMSLIFSFASGSDFVVTSNNAWESANKIQAANAVNLFSSASNDWYMTGLQMEIGEVATPFERERYDTTLVKCQRYYYKVEHSYGSIDIGAGLETTTTQARIFVPFPVEMRSHATAVETSSTAGNFDITHNNSVLISNAVPTYSNANRTGASVFFAHASGGTAGQGCTGRLRVAGTYLAWKAEV